MATPKVRVVTIDDETRDQVTTSYERMGAVSDGYHTFEELYHHRMALTAALGNALGFGDKCWRSKKHASGDEPMFEGFFIVGIDLPGAGLITYHYKLENWDLFVGFKELETAPVWDGHTPDDVIGLLESFAVSK